MKIDCKLCSDKIAKNLFKKHLKEVHEIDSIELYALDVLGYTNKCKQCGKNTNFLNLVKGFRDFCSNKCSSTYYANDKLVKAKRKKTNTKLYGGHPSQNKSIKLKVSKQLELNKLDPEYQSKINKKRKETCLEKYGVEYTSQSINYQNSIQNKLKLKYESITDYRLISKNSINYYTFKCDICSKEFTIHRHLIKQRFDKNIKVCTNCIKKNSYSYPEQKLTEFIENNYHGEILINNRTMLSGKELDIYLPQLNLAFEFNGLYWHSELHRDKNYHLDKTELCESKDIHLIQIYEDDWKNKNSIVKSRILNLLGKSDRIYARKCEIKYVSNKESKIFLDNNHIQGKINSKYSYGLYYDNELVSLMNFGINRFRKDKTIELLRFCNKINTVVIGGASKLFKYAIKINTWQTVLSYADRSWSIGNVYKTLGFKYDGKTPPNYYYIENNKRNNRFKYRKSKLVSNGYDNNLTEREIMFNRKIYRIYDSGSLIFTYIS